MNTHQNVDNLSQQFINGDISSYVINTSLKNQNNGNITHVIINTCKIPFLLQLLYLY